MTLISTSLESKTRTGAQWCAIALGFTLPISTALDNVLLILFIVLWLLSSELSAILRFVRGHPVALAACVFAALILFGTLWSAASAIQLRDAWVDASRFIVLGAFAIVFLDASTRDRAQFAFLLSSLLVLMLSFALWSGIIDVFPGRSGGTDDALVFKNDRTHSVLMAIAAILFTLHALEAQNRRARMLLFALAGAAMIDVFVLVPALSGQLGLSAAVLHLAFAQRRWRGAAMVAAALVVLGSVVWLTRSSELHVGDSIHARLQLYNNALELIGEHPVIGGGVGAFRSLHEAKVRGTQMAVVDHPHNAFLHVGVELGLLGLAALVALLAVQWRSAGRMSDFTDRAAARAFIMIFVVAGLVSISYGDHTEGLFYSWASGLFFATARWPDKPNDGKAS